MPKEKVSHADMVVDLIDDDEVITLYDEEDNLVAFYQIACIQHKDDIYVMLQPADPIEGMEEGEVVILKFIEGEGDEDNYEPVSDDELLDEIFQAYLKAVESEGTCCCGHDHDHDHCCDDEEEEEGDEE